MKIAVGRRWILVGLVALLLGGAGWLAAGPLLRSEAPEGSGPLLGADPAAAGAPAAGAAATLRGAHAESPPPAPASATTEAGAPPPQAAGTTGGAVGALSAADAFRPTPLDEVLFAAAAPAQVASPVAPPPRGPALGAGPGPGGGGPTGHWTRFPNLPARAGPARLAVLVLDERDEPVPGAVVYLAPPATAQQEAVSFGDLRTLGTTNDAGRLDVDRLPEGAAVVAANLHGRLNGPRGLDVRHAARVVLEARREVRVVLSLPLVVAETGAIEGRVVGDDGSAIQSASAATAFRREWTDADGRFRIEGVLAGPGRLTVGATGRRTENVPVDVPAGGTQQVVVTLHFSDTGSLRIDGLARLPDGTSVGGATVYLMVEGDRGTLRRTLTDETGAFRFEDLPDRLREAACRLQVTGFPRYRTGLLVLPDGVRDEQVVVDVPGAYARIRLRLLDAATGAPLAVADVDFVGEEAPAGGRRAGALTFDHDAGTWEGFFEGGRGTLKVATLTHGSWEQTLDLSREGGEVAVEARLARVADDPVTVALDVRVRRRADEAPVDRVRIEVRDASSGEPLSRFEGGRPDGRYRLPAPSGTRRLRVAAEGYETSEQDLLLDPALPEVAVDVHLVPAP